MKLRSTLFALFMAFVFALPTVAQNSNVSLVKDGHTEPCHFDQRHKHLMATDADYRARIDQNRQIVQNLVNNAAFRSGTDTLWIPIVVHVMHLGEAVGTTTNISDAQIQSAIDNMNDRYNGTVGTTSDTKIQFCLAQRDTNGVATTGIVRIDASSHTSGGDNYGTLGITSNNEQGVKNLSKWDHNLYCNVWVVSEIEDNGGGAGTQGYAYFPGASASVDGIVCLYNAFGYDPTTALGYELKSFTNENTTMTHEVGHYLDLFHTFEGDADGTFCPSNADCNTEGDEICDTQAHIRSGTGCPSGANACDVGNLEDIVDNYMNYASESCTVNFTTGQKDRMRAAACGTRSGLLGGLQCSSTLPYPAPAAPTCSPNYTTPNSNNIGITNITIGDLDVSSLTSQYDDGRADRSLNHYTVLSTNTVTNIDIDLGTTNNQDIEVYIDYNNDGDFDDTGENVYSASSVTTSSGTFTTASSPTENQLLRMRIIVDFAGFTISGPCYNPQLGEVEEYSVVFPAASPAPVANFSADQTATCTGQTVVFTDASTNATDWSWNFGSGASPATASTQGPHSVTYSTVGSKDVTLDVTGPGGADNETKNSYVSISTPVALSGTLTTTDETCDGFDGTATVTVTAGSGSYNYLWSDAQNSQTATGLAAGIYNVTVTDATSGCTATANGFNVGQDCTVPDTEVSAAYCGVTLTSMASYITCNPVANAERYQWEFVHGASGFLEEVTSFSFAPTSTQMALNLVPGISYNTTYDVRVRAKVGGDWGGYSTICTITTPATIPTTTLSTASCNSTVTSMSDYFTWNAVPGAERYQMEITDGGSFNQTPFNLSYIPSSTFYSLGLVPGVDYNTTYNVRIRTKVGGVWGSYGGMCTLSTPAVQPTPELVPGDCGTTLSSIYEYFYISPIPGAQRYGYEISDGVDFTTEIFTPSYAPSVTWMTLGFANGIDFNTTYNVRVRAKVAGVWGSYGNTCTLTTPVDPGKNAEWGTLSEQRETQLMVWPNPSNGAINVGLTGLEAGDNDITIRVFDMVGRQVFSAKRLSSESAMIDQLNTNGNFSKGMYILRVSVNGTDYTERIVVE